MPKHKPKRRWMDPIFDLEAIDGDPGQAEARVAALARENRQTRRMIAKEARKRLKRKGKA